MYKIINKKRLNSMVEQMVIHAPHVATNCEAGQFIILCTNENSERIPLTIQDYNREEGTISIVYQVVGYSTLELSKKEAGEEIAHFAGPLGVETAISKKKRVLGIGGGVGAAPLFPQIRKFTELGTECDVILGGRSDEFVILEDEFKQVCQNVYCATNDGSKGTQGFVTDVLKELLDKGNEYDEVVAIGPLIMMKAVVGVTKPLGIKTMVSLNPIMIDGTGMCGCCRVSVDGQTKFACIDGPDFDGYGVDFDEAMVRQNMYKKEETHICNLTGEVR
ncbi:MAG: ferredoxin-NADP reductase [Epulopiscium sp. Nele67-Bin001]|nr:MAG: ferredoxin-NADP reductase [Epulopiscium sp. Nuni2H_MBin001]OON91375.1 MAG: ferredoxin-NADP reductase [Epulopiscium sp. Nele67-Bin001]